MKKAVLLMEILKACALFTGIDEADVGAILECLGARQKHYEKNTFVFIADTPLSAAIPVGILLSGRVHLIQDDFWGNRSIIAQVKPGGLVGEAFACGELSRLPVSAFAAEASDMLLVDYKRIITLCSSVCAFHSRLIRNIIRILAEHNSILIQKIEHITRRTTREKLRSYLSREAQKAGTSHFDIPFNRQELADYLGVDRSAMSNELCKMRNEGILNFDRNHFFLFQNSRKAGSVGPLD
ncbi:MAG: Crp/Fnr family transcriptional regulator [Treponema sp.]|jgi:CRP-like cAMP-binding protein|nr:Crp/Fnr family transcriptional regulator [Treponema sp.]